MLRCTHSEKRRTRRTTGDTSEYQIRKLPSTSQLSTQLVGSISENLVTRKDNTRIDSGRLGAQIFFMKKAYLHFYRSCKQLLILAITSTKHLRGWSRAFGCSVTLYAHERPGKKPRAGARVCGRFEHCAVESAVVTCCRTSRRTHQRGRGVQQCISMASTTAVGNARGNKGCKGAHRRMSSLGVIGMLILKPL